MALPEDIVIGEHRIKAGQSAKVMLPVAKLYTDAEVSLPVFISRSKKAGPTVLICAAVHGDELNGIEIIHRLIRDKKLKPSCGTVIAVPMVNVYGVINQSRYLPDRRDLNRSFPGSAKGSLASRLANIFLNQCVLHCDYGIDLHTGAIHRSNLPQIRANLDEADLSGLANAFGAPVVINTTNPKGSLREAAAKSGTKIMVYEAGEALRTDEFSVHIGYRGVLNVLRALNMLPKSRKKKSSTLPFIAHSSDWIRATASGFVSHKLELGEQVEKGTVLADVVDPFGEVLALVKAPRKGIIIGKQNIPLVQEGEAMYHIGYFTADEAEISQHIDNEENAIVDGESEAH
jgi:predicted deacylase